MKCPGCGHELQGGAVRIDKSLAGALFSIFSMFIHSGSTDSPRHLYFKSADGSANDAVIREGRTHAAYRCPQCRTLVIAGES